MNKLATHQLSGYLSSIAGFKAVRMPPKGWVRAIRNSLGMSRRQLANRLGLSTSRIQGLEEDEVAGAVTVKSLRKTAEAMDCVFVYALIPVDSLESMIENQAIKKAKKHVQNTDQTMALEEQSVSQEAKQLLITSVARKIAEKPGRYFWDDN